MKLKNCCFRLIKSNKCKNNPIYKKLIYYNIHTNNLRAIKQTNPLLVFVNNIFINGWLEITYLLHKMILFIHKKINKKIIL